MLNIDEILTMENKAQPLIEKIKSFDNILFYGLGGYLRGRIENYIQWLGSPAFIIDKFYPNGGEYQGIPIVNSLSVAKDRLGDSDKFCVIITAPSFRKEITEECKKVISEERIFDFSFESQTTPFYKDFLKSNKDAIVDFYNSLSDEKSRQTLEGFIKGKDSADLNFFRKICIPNRADNTLKLSVERSDKELQRIYFPHDIFTISRDEVFVDCGAYTGDTLEDFVSEANGKYANVICIELDTKCFAQLTVNAQKSNRIICVNCGVWDENKTIKVASDNAAMMTTVEESSSGVVLEFKKLDDIVSECNVIPTYIKMDVEGAELKALHGGMRIIREYKPKLAICIYHKNEDIVQIPKFIHELNPDYKFYVRHYSYCSSELVLYAI